MDIRAHLAQGKPLLFDGAMGTYYATLPGREDVRCEKAVLLYPEEVKTIHKAYLDAGCHAIKTNTFSLGEDLGDGNDAFVRAVIEAGSQLALETIRGYDAQVFANLGPVPTGRKRSPGQLYCLQAEWFLQQGLTCFLVETLSTDEGIAELAQWLKERCPEAYLIVSYAAGYDGVTRMGYLGADLYRRTAALPGVDAVGFNCVSGPHHMLENIRDLQLADKPLSIMPNAGYPTVLGSRTVFQGKPTYFADHMARCVQLGAMILGGCCGTTPEDIALTAKLLKNPLPRVRREAAGKQEKQGGSGVPAANPFWDKLERGERVIAVELDPPVDDDCADFLEGVASLRDAGVDAVTIADCPIGRPRADSSLLACKIKRELGMDPLPHMTCRDRNLNATKALLLGLSIEGVRNVLLVTGDPIPTEHRDEVKSVFNFNSRKLARYVNSLNDTTFHAPIRIFGALNINARNFDTQLKMAQEKEACGVVGFLTQPVLSDRGLENLKRAREVLHGKLLGGIFPIVSYRNACFLNNEVAGIQVSEEIISMYEGKEREEAEDLAVLISANIAQDMRPYTDGFYLMTPFRRVELMERIIALIR